VDNLPTGPSALNEIHHALNRAKRSLTLFQTGDVGSGYQTLTEIDAAAELLRTLKDTVRRQIRELEAERAKEEHK